MNLTADPNDREYSEVWPGGRTNHYWFDMNRDWLPVQLPESRARIETYHQWLPNILTDITKWGPIQLSSFSQVFLNVYIH